MLSQRPRGTPCAHNLLGTVRSARGDTAAAAESFRTAAGLAPTSPVFLRNLGLAELALGRAGAAAAVLEAAVSIDPVDCLSVTALAQVKAAFLRPAEATVRRCVGDEASSPVAAGHPVELVVRQNRLEDALAAVDAHALLLQDPATLRAEVLLGLA